MKPQAFIFIGRSGSGKGTQADLLIKALQKNDSSRKSLYIYSGEELRKFIQGNSYIEKKANDLYRTGSLMTEFVTVYVWVKKLVEEYDGTQHLVFDGTPRKIHEAGVLGSVFQLLETERPWVINIDISREEAVRRLVLRKRVDDDEKKINSRLDWFESEVKPTIDYFRAHPDYRFVTINGERSIEEVHADVAKTVGLI